MEVCTALVDDLRELAAQAANDGSPVAFQSTLAAATQAVERALRCETDAQAAALSLAQREALQAMTAELSAMAEALQAVLDRQGRCLLPQDESKRSPLRNVLRLRKERTLEAPRPTWWFSLSEAIETLGEGAERMEALAAGQPTEAPSRTLSQEAAAVLRDHHARLLAHADRWMA